jgi:hypothetical protein
MDSEKLLNSLRSDPLLKTYYETKQLSYGHQRIEERKMFRKRLNNAIRFEMKEGLGNDISVKFILEMRKMALEILQTQYLSAGEGSHLILDVFNLLEELPGKKFPHNYFLLQAADTIRRNTHSLMDPKS